MSNSNAWIVNLAENYWRLSNKLPFAPLIWKHLGIPIHKASSLIYTMKIPDDTLSRLTYLLISSYYAFTSSFSAIMPPPPPVSLICIRSLMAFWSPGRKKKVRKQMKYTCTVRPLESHALRKVFALIVVHKGLELTLILTWRHKIT